MKSDTATNDEVLVKRFNAGEESAKQTIYDMYVTHLCLFATRIIHDKAEAEDITVVTLEILLRRHADFNTMSNIKAFLYITVKNRSLKYLEASKRKQHGQKELMNGADKQEDYILAQMVRAEFLQEVYSQIENLPQTQKAIFKMFYLEGLNCTEIATKLNMSLGTVYNNKSLALKHLRITLLGNKLLPVIVGFSIWLAKSLFCL